MPYHQQCMGPACPGLACQTHLGWAVLDCLVSVLEKQLRPAVQNKPRLKCLNSGGTACPLWHPCLPPHPFDPALQEARAARAAFAALKPPQAACWLKLAFAESLAKVVDAVASQVWERCLGVSLHLATAI